MIKLETIEKDTLWVVKMTGWRKVGTYEEVEYLMNDEDCRDFDLCATQPEHLKEFYDVYFNYNRNSGESWLTVQEYYEQYYSKTAEKPIKPLNLNQCWRMVNRADTHEKIAIAEKWLLKANISTEEFDDLMMALSQKSRELYNPKW